MRRFRSKVSDVFRRIDEQIWNPSLRVELKKKVTEYDQTGNPAKDLTPQESNLIYRDVEFGKDVPLSRKRELEIDWSSHAEYRSELRDVSPDRVNETITERLKEHLQRPEHRKVNFKEPGVGTMVVDYDTQRNPAEADVITVWSSQRNRKSKERIMNTATVVSKITTRQAGIMLNPDNIVAEAKRRGMVLTPEGGVHVYAMDQLGRIDTSGKIVHFDGEDGLEKFARQSERVNESVQSKIDNFAELSKRLKVLMGKHKVAVEGQEDIDATTKYYEGNVTPFLVATERSRDPLLIALKEDMYKVYLSIQRGNFFAAKEKLGDVLPGVDSLVEKWSAQIENFKDRRMFALAVINLLRKNPDAKARLMAASSKFNRNMVARELVVIAKLIAER